MWRNVSWNSTDSSLPDGMHKHDPGAYFKTPSIQSGASSQSGGQGAGRRGDSVESCSRGPRPGTPPSREERQEAWPAPSQAGTQRPRLRDPAARQLSSGPAPAPPAAPAAATGGGAGKQQAAGPNFRSRLSSISGALQHPKLARRLFSGHHEPGEPSQQQQQTVQITTTSIDSPQHNQNHEAHEPEAAGRPAGASSSGRRLSQLFLPQMGQSPILLGQLQDPYACNELIPPHLLGIYGQPPLVGGAAGSPAGHRASWADVSLFGRLSNVRPSIDSALQAGQMRHSFDARKYIWPQSAPGARPSPSESVPPTGPHDCLSFSAPTEFGLGGREIERTNRNRLKSDRRPI